jgi:hypothetical protein
MRREVERESGVVGARGEQKTSPVVFFYLVLDQVEVHILAGRQTGGQLADDVSDGRDAGLRDEWRKRD